MRVRFEDFNLGEDDRGNQYICYAYENDIGGSFTHLLNIDNLGRLIDRLRALYERSVYGVDVGYTNTIRCDKNGNKYEYEVNYDKARRKERKKVR